MTARTKQTLEDSN